MEREEFSKLIDSIRDDRIVLCGIKIRIEGFMKRLEVADRALQRIENNMQQLMEIAENEV